jgi:uncharacterized protein (TIGR03435 family)
MTRRFATALLVCAATALPARAQRPAFEVASIKRNVSVGQLSSIRGQPGGRITVTNHSLRSIIRQINRLQGDQIVGGPDWVDKDRWDIVAKGEGDPAFEQLVAMMQTLLADRFKLVTHRETRDMPVYALVLARSDGRLGPQLQTSTVDCAAIAAAARTQGGTAPPPPGAGPRCGTNMSFGRMRTSAVPMTDIARNFSIAAGRTVVDRTGLTGIFDLDVTWKPDVPAGSAGPAGNISTDDAPSLFTALQEQLGLKLDAQRGPVEVLVIDSAERPVED